MSLAVILVAVIVSLSALLLCVLVSPCPLKKMYSYKAAVVPDGNIMVRTDEETGRGAEET